MFKTSRWKATGVATAILTAMTATSVAPVVHAQQVPEQSTKAPVKVSQNDVFLSDYSLTSEQQRYFDNVVEIGEYFEYDANGNLVLPVEDDLLRGHGFSQSDINLLRTSIDDAGNGSATQNTVSPMVHVSDGALYISHHDLVSGIAVGVGTAASVGPAALQAALISLGTLLGGPVGSVISTVIAIAGMPSMIELAGRITFALATGQGIYIDPVLSYPPLQFGYW